MVADFDDVKVNTGSAAVKQQAITWVGVNPDLYHHVVSLGPIELTLCSVYTISLSWRSWLGHPTIIF